MYDASLSSSVYFELDITGNVRRLRGGKALSTSAPLASDLGGYRYTAFGHLNTTDTTTAYPSVAGQRYDQPLRWQSRWFIDSGSGLYDFRARVWSPELAAFLQPDEYGFLTRSGTLWSWPGQNPFRYADPTGRDAIGRWIGSAVGEILGGGIGGALGAVAGGAATVETGPGAVAGAGVGAFEGGSLGAEVGALAGGEVGDALGDALKGLIARATSNDQKECKAGDKDASAPVGHDGKPLNVPPGTNQSTDIGDRTYTGHALDQMQGRGIPPSVVENTVQNGGEASGNVPGTSTFYDPTNDVTVVTDSASGRVVTVRRGAP